MEDEMNFARVPGFPYVVYYTIDTRAREVRVLRILHARQDKDD